ncbi:MAG: glycosyltransferase [Lachnospiraceae bacterium]|nr:glycosyltransferase [Lachnospiraceae bacterium]
MKISFITPFYEGNIYMPDYQDMMEKNEEKLKASNAVDDTDLYMEVILVNDSPGTAIRLDGIYTGRENWHIITNKKNMGIHGSRVAGLAVATGDVVCFLDQDDKIRPETAFEMLRAAQRHPYKVIVANGDFEIKNELHRIYRTDAHKAMIGELSAYIKVGTQIISPGQCAIPRSVIPEFWCENIMGKNGADDYFLWLLLLGQGIGFHYLDRNLYIHSYTGDNLSADTRVTDESSYEFIDMMGNGSFLSDDELRKLRRMISYKADFRRAGLMGKLGLTLKNPDIFAANLIYKLRTKTPYGYNR